MDKTTMKAVVHTKYGSPDYLQLKEIPKPIPKDNEVLIRIVATTVTPFDVGVRRGKFPPLTWLPLRLMFGLLKPRNLILGYEFAGIIEMTGSQVSLYNKGDKVFGSTYRKMSCHAEYISLPETSPITLVPNNLDFKQAAAIPDGSSTALYFLQKANVQKGDDVLIYGASGCVGTYAIQLAKYFGASVTAVCSTPNFELVRSLGSTSTIDYTQDDYSTQDKLYDIIFDTVGKSSFDQAKNSLKKNALSLQRDLNYLPLC